MQVQESFYRGNPLKSEARTLPGQTYNLAYTLLKKCGEASLFVPIRNMQYLAVLDSEEFIFVDSIVGRAISIAWQGFKPSGRGSLTDPVPYTAVYYHADAEEIMKRLQAEFFKALQLLAECQKQESDAQLLPFPDSKSKQSH
jgi:hypothetical protein